MRNWPTAVINIVEEFKSDFRVITMDQRYATNGESTGPVPVANPWDAFADDQLGVMDHLGIDKSPKNHPFAGLVVRTGILDVEKKIGDEFECGLEKHMIGVFE
jgi:pimeloyl-ACP methyl ester carboxylesterase